MKKEKNRKKERENLVGKIIYSFLLFAPLLSILATCVYTIINENAKDSYYGETINEEQTTYLEQNERIYPEETYYLNTYNMPQMSGGSIFVSNFKIVEPGNLSTNYQNLIDENEIYRLYFYLQNNSQMIDMYKYIPESNSQSWVLGTNAYFTASFKLTAIETQINQIKTEIYHITYNKFSYMDNVFEYSIYKVENNDLYNWAKTTGTYTVVQNTSALLGITNTFIPMLLTYWLIISIIYIIYDIGLIMIWIAHNKVHELIESV